MTIYKTASIYLYIACALCLTGAYGPLAYAEDGEAKAVSLEECIRMAAKNSFEVRLARLDLLIAGTDRGVAESVFDTSLFSNISYADQQSRDNSAFGGHSLTNIYEGGASKTFHSGTELTSTVSDTRSWSNAGFTAQNPAHEVEVSLDGRQPVGKNYFGVNDRRDISVTKLAIKNSGLDMKDRIEALFASVEESYRKWAFAKENLRIYNAILKEAKDLYGINKNNFDLGRIEKGDLLASQANVITRRKNVRQAENDYRGAEEHVKLIINSAESDRLYPSDELKHEDIDVALESSLRTAFEKRRDYHKAKREVKMKNITLKTKSNERFPEIDLVGTYSANGIDRVFRKATKKFSGNDAYFFGGVEVTIPLENSSADAEYDKAAHDKEKAILSLKSVERQILTDVGDAVRDYFTHAATFKNLKEVADLQSEKLMEEEKRFNSGRSDTKRLIDYQQDSLNADLQLANGVLDLELARISLEKTLNTMLDKYEGLL
ncbi:TolC family protein [Candidatus Omnitrophota bacterium]